MYTKPIVAFSMEIKLIAYPDANRRKKEKTQSNAVENVRVIIFEQYLKAGFTLSSLAQISTI